jgi:hypothetical protein
LPQFVSGGWDYLNNGGSLIIPAPQFVSGGWDNRNMRMKLASTVIVIGLFASSMAPANALFGLSTCEKVKKQILAFEKTEKPMIAEWGNYAGDWIWDYSQKSQLEIQKKWIKIVNLEVKMYSLEINHPKCFTNSQNIYIKSIYPKWKKHQQTNKFYPNSNNADSGNGYYIGISWDSIYNQ